MTFAKPSKELHRQTTLAEKVSLDAKDFSDKRDGTVSLFHENGQNELLLFERKPPVGAELIQKACFII